MIESYREARARLYRAVGLDPEAPPPSPRFGPSPLEPVWEILETPRRWPEPPPSAATTPQETAPGSVAPYVPRWARPKPPRIPPPGRPDPPSPPATGFRLWSGMRMIDHGAPACEWQRLYREIERLLATHGRRGGGPCESS